MWLRAVMWKECDKILALYINICDPVFYGQPQMGLVTLTLKAAKFIPLGMSTYILVPSNLGVLGVWLSCLSWC